MERTDGLVSRLYASLREYLGLQREYMTLSLTEMLTRLLTAVILFVILFVVFIITLIFVAMVLVSLMRTLTGNAMLSYGLVALLFAAIGVLLYVMRKPWIERPLTNYIGNELLKDEDENLQ
jgi:hypothetical protein